MNIALFSDNFYPEISGIGDSISLLGDELVRRGHSVMFVAPKYSKKNYEKAGVVDSIDRDALYKTAGKNILRLPSIKYASLSTGQARIVLPIGASLQALRKFKPDIIHTQTPFGAGLEALLASRVLRIPLVGTNHTPPALFMPESIKHSKFATNTVLKYFSWYYNRCVFVSAPCEALLADMAKHGLHRDTIENHAVSNPINLAAFQAMADDMPNDTHGAQNDERTTHDLKKRFNFSPHTILYTGRLAPEKKIDVVIRAVALVKAEIPDVTFAITGHGSAETSLRQLAKDLGVEKNVQFIGFVNAATLPLIYRASDVFTMMSIAETQSLSMMQAMAIGKPVIGARAWGLPEYIDDQKNGYVLEPGDHKGLAKILIELFKSPALMHKLGENGIETVKKYSPSAIAEQWENIFKKACYTIDHENIRRHSSVQ